MGNDQPHISNIYDYVLKEKTTGVLSGWVGTEEGVKSKLEKHDVVEKSHLLMGERQRASRFIEKYVTKKRAVSVVKDIIMALTIQGAPVRKKDLKHWEGTINEIENYD